MLNHPQPTDRLRAVDSEFHRWERIFQGPEYYYGSEPGPVARRAVRYHRPGLPVGGTALDLGCGEGQDLRFLADSGYQVTGVEFTTGGASKSRQLVEHLPGATVVQADLREYLAAEAPPQFDLVLAVNSLQFLGLDAPRCFERLRHFVAPGGVLGVSLFAQDEGGPEFSGTLWFTTLRHLLSQLPGWQPLEAANLWQWSGVTNQPQPFVTLIARKTG